LEADRAVALATGTLNDMGCARYSAHWAAHGSASPCWDFAAGLSPERGAAPGVGGLSAIGGTLPLWLSVDSNRGHAVDLAALGRSPVAAPAAPCGLPSGLRFVALTAAAFWPPVIDAGDRLVRRLGRLAGNGPVIALRAAAHAVLSRSAIHPRRCLIDRSRHTVRRNLFANALGSLRERIFTRSRGAIGVIGLCHFRRGRTQQEPRPDNDLSGSAHGRKRVTDRPRKRQISRRCGARAQQSEKA